MWTGGTCKRNGTEPQRTGGYCRNKLDENGFVPMELHNRVYFQLVWPNGREMSTVPSRIRRGCIEGNSNQHRKLTMDSKLAFIFVPGGDIDQAMDVKSLPK
ncbi:MAG: hypothetical protein CM1200mP30_14720 [Pseudomonadota bacterium]|nr:MAG: hypothetical protein CM1200mP30_14720 [Pseudomonadota bacterium]